MVRTLTILLASAAMALGQGFTMRDTAFLGVSIGRGDSRVYDTFEGYSDNVSANTLNGGLNFNGAFSDRSGITGVVDSDTVESYSDASALNGLSGGSGFTSGYVDRYNIIGVTQIDDMESYSDTAAVNGLNGGTGILSAWGGSYVDR